MQFLEDGDQTVVAVNIAKVWFMMLMFKFDFVIG